MKERFFVAAGAALFIGLFVFVEFSGALEKQAEAFGSELESAVKSAYETGLQEGQKQAVRLDPAMVALVNKALDKRSDA